MKLTHENIHALGTSGVGFNSHQLILLCGTARPSKGWLSRLIGTEIADEVYVQAVALKGQKKRGRFRGFNPRTQPLKG